MSDELRSDFDVATENRILLGQQSGSIGGLQERAGIAQSSEQQREKQRQKCETTSCDIEILAQLRSDLANMEEGFRFRDGDAWRENLALKILEPDVFPQCREGESIKAFRARLEKQVIDEMLNPDGSIKEKYKNHPEYSDYAQWAQKRLHYNRARGLVRELEDKNTKLERKQEIEDAFERRASVEELTFAARNALKQAPQHAIKDIADSIEDSNLREASTSDGINNLLRPKL